MRVIRCATAGVGLHVDWTARVASFYRCLAVVVESEKSSTNWSDDPPRQI